MSGRFTGRLERLDVEGGPWVLHATDGATYHLVGDLGPARRLLGRRVRVHGRLAPDVMTSAQVGPVVEVASVEPDD